MPTGTAYRGSLIFSFTPSNSLPARSYPGRVAGWSESLWFQQTVPPDGFLRWANSALAFDGGRLPNLGMAFDAIRLFREQDATGP